jgi:hypothetical protein
MTTISVNLPEWVINEIIGDPINKSARVTELLVKAYMQEKEKAFMEAQKSTIKMGPLLRLVVRYYYDILRIRFHVLRH